MKARPVRKLDPSHSLGENAARIIQVRLDEMKSFAPRALDGKMKAQHDMRIAAKRLRYVLEVTGFAFGKPADTARRRARDLQDILGEIHDCDVMLPRVREHLKRCSEMTRRRCGEGRKAPDLDPRLAARAPTGRHIADSTCSPCIWRPAACCSRTASRHSGGGRIAGTWVRLERAVEGHLQRAREARRTARAAERARAQAEAAERAARQAEAQAEQARLDRERATRASAAPRSGTSRRHRTGEPPPRLPR